MTLALSTYTFFSKIGHFFISFYQVLSSVSYQSMFLEVVANDTFRIFEYIYHLATGKNMEPLLTDIAYLISA